jgi:hypothetical protein
VGPGTPTATPARNGVWVKPEDGIPPFVGNSIPRTHVLNPESHYSVVQVAKLWSISPDLVRDLFRSESGVLKIERPAGRFKRVYTTLRIPQSVLNRVATRLGGVR